MIGWSSRGLIHSLLLIIIAGGIAFFSGGGPQADSPDPGPNPRVLGGQAHRCAGTKLNYPRVVEEKIPNGKTVTFRYNCVRKDFIAGSYDGNCKGCSGQTHFTDEPVRWGLCAVDPQVILPHSIFYIPGYGPCRAADKGQAVKGKRIDLGFEDVRQGWWSLRSTDIFTFIERREIKASDLESRPFVK